MLAVLVGSVALLMNHLQAQSLQREMQARTRLLLSFGQACRQYCREELEAAVQGRLYPAARDEMFATLVVRDIFAYINNEHRGYRYKQAVIDSRSSVNRADEFERQVVSDFQSDRGFQRADGRADSG